MILKLTKMGGVVRYIETSSIFHQPVANNRIDIEVSLANGTAERILIGEDDAPSGCGDIWSRAYVMEHGKTVDTIRSWLQPPSPSSSPAAPQP